MCDLVKARRPPSMHGRSLLGAMLGEPPPRERVYAELLPAPSWNHHWRAIVDGTWKLIDKLSENTIELYDLAKDPTEQHNVAAANQELVGRLGRAMKGILNGETG